MTVLVTGGAGFLGRRLAERLLELGTLADRHGAASRIDRLVLLDVTAGARLADSRVEQITGDLGDPAILRSLVDAQTSAIFHLAAVVSGQAEADFDLGLRVNLDATRILLERCRAAGHAPRVVFASSVAVYGGTLPDIVPETWAVRPQSSYGMEKAAGELLVCDYTRRGFIDGRVLRLPTISVRPGRPNAAASSFASGIIREPLNGEIAVCPVDPGTRMWLLSPRSAIDALIRGHDLPPEAWEGNRVLNLPGLSVTVAEMVEALERVAGADVAGRVRWERDERIVSIASTWPGALDDSRARALGFETDTDMEDVIRRYIQGV